MDDQPVRSAGVRRVQRNALVLLVAVGMLNYVDRAALAVANPLIRHDLGVSIGEMGLLLSAFLWSYAIFQLPAGVLADRLGARRLMPAAIMIWSLAQAFGGLVSGFGQLFGSRVLLGLGESPQAPTSARITRDWFNVTRRGTATGIWNGSPALGNALSVPLLTALMLSFGWRWMFIVMGLVGLVMAACFYLVHRDPAEAGLTASDHAYLTAGDVRSSAGPVTWASWRRLFAFRTTWGIMLGYMGLTNLIYIYFTWLPAYLEIDRQMSIARTGMVATVPYVFGVVGALFGGRLADWLVARGVSPINSRKYPMTAALLLTAAFTVLTALTPSNAIAVASISITMFMLYVASCTGWAMVSVAAPPNCTASVGSLQNFGGYLGGSLAPLVTGLIVEDTGSFLPALLLGAAIAAVAGLGYFFVIQGPIPEDTSDA